MRLVVDSNKIISVPNEHLGKKIRSFQMSKHIPNEYFKTYTEQVVVLIDAIGL